MAQRKPEIDEILRLVDKLSPEEHDQLLEELKRQWLRMALQQGEDSCRQHGGRPAEEVFTEVIEGYEGRKSAE